MDIIQLLPKVARLLLLISVFGACGGSVATTPNAVDSDKESLAKTSALTTDTFVTPLLGNYNISEGPGMVVVTNTNFVLSINGHIVATGQWDEDPQQIFIPITFVPGENTVQIEAQTSHPKTASVAVILQDLEDTWESNTSWQAASDVAQPAWEQAISRGELAHPPVATAKPVHMLWSADKNSSNVLLRKTINLHPVGFGQTTTGAGNLGAVAPVVATSPAELISAIGATGPSLILIPEGHMDFRLPGTEIPVCVQTCTQDQSFYVSNPSSQPCEASSGFSGASKMLDHGNKIVITGSNKTIMGLGRGALLQGAEFILENVNNLIVRNITFFDINPSIASAGSAIQVYTPEPNQASSNIWIDHATFAFIGDKSMTSWIDPSFASNANDFAVTGMTISWSIFNGINPGNCQPFAAGNNPWATDFQSAQLTMHHNWWKGHVGRTPLLENPASFGHLFNNLNSNQTAAGAHLAIEVGCKARLLEEGDYYNTPYATWLAGGTNYCSGNSAEISGSGMALVVGANNLIVDPQDSAVTTWNSIIQSDFILPYTYALHDADQGHSKVLNHAGSGGHWGQIWSVQPSIDLNNTGPLGP